MKLRFDTFKAETLPTVEYFRSRGKCVEIDTSLDRQAVFKIVCDQLAMLSPEASEPKPLTQRAEILLGLKPYPKESCK
jgi:UMP-CMP kinase